MAKLSNLETFTNFIKCLSVFESNTCLLYKDLAEKVDLPLIKSLFLEISLDSKKHSSLLKGVAQSLQQTGWKPTDCPKEIGEAWRSIETFQIELSQIEKLPEEDLPELAEQLVTLESIMGEEYNVFVNFETLELITNELGQLYNVNFESFKSIFMEIIHDEEHHKEILSMIRELLNREEKAEKTNVPIVQFRNPDAWSRPIPSSP
jgi:rubrerythrin